MSTKDSLEILNFTPELKPWFERLNLEWLERYFVVEDVDKLVLQQPEKYVLAKGGAVIFGRYQGEIVGTCALKHHGDGVYELIKMAVTDSVQGKGFGRVLLNAAVDRYRELSRDLSDKSLFLESHHSLAAALKLYESGGFKHAERPAGPTAYVRSDIYMVLDE